MEENNGTSTSFANCLDVYVHLSACYVQYRSQILAEFCGKEAQNPVPLQPFKM